MEFSGENDYIVIPEKDFVYFVDIFPCESGLVVVRFIKRPNLIYRFWTWVFFGWRFLPIERRND